ncbi:MAG: hydrogenase iron-sulfur subunit [Halanaerobiales bacterium]|nr:hydrogenase iron-sulfur subunit [Halanaerobiales bacterium]
MLDIIYIGDQIKSPKLNTLCIKPEALIEFEGEIGNFKLQVKDDDKKLKDLKTKYIVINIDAVRENNLEDTLNLDLDLDQLDPNQDIIIIQDYEQISPAVINKEALNKAIEIKNKLSEKEVYFLYRSMRFIDDNDSLFEEARQKGIIFLQYEMGNLEFIDKDKVKYERDGLTSELQGQILTTPLLKPDQRLKRIIRLLNIESNGNEYIQSTNIYLQPSLTGKRGVYSLAGARGPNAYSEYEFEKEFTLNEIKSNLDNFEPLTENKRVVDDKKCILCYTCYRVCPHGAVQEDKENDAMKINELACYGCDGCISHCPASAISIQEKTEQKASNNLLKVLMCENSADTAYKKIDKGSFKDLDIEKIPCASSIKKEDIFKFLRKKDSRLLILGCFEDSCKHITGDGRGNRITNEIRDTLKKLDLNHNRVIFERLSPRMEEDLNGFLLKWKEGESS